MTTEYMVLSKDQSGYWREVDMVAAATARDAVTLCAEDEGTYVAVPGRSWKPAGLKVETVTRKVWGGDTNGDTPPTTTKETP